jgi:8-oxo-dGTP diphosphatase
VLLVQRMFDPQKGQWTLPSGFVDAGEDPRAAAARECLEETGLQINDLRLLDVLYSHEYPRGASILILYQAQVKSGELRPGDDARQAAYFDIHKLPQLAFLSTHHILDLYV